jgi:hypothetical protein
MGFVSPTDPAGLDVFWQKKTWEQPRFPWIFLGCSLDVPWIFHGQNTRKRLMDSDLSLIFDNSGHLNPSEPRFTMDML